MNTSELSPANVRELVDKALKEAKSSVSWRKRIRTRWPEWFSFTADTIAILTALYGASRLPQILSNYEAFFQIIIIYILFILLLIALAWQIHTFARKSRYAEALPYLHAIIHNTRDTVYNIHRNVTTSSDIKYKTILNLTFFSQAFSMITGTKCRASFKMTDAATDAEVEIASKQNSEYNELNLDKHRYIARTYARDAESSMLCVQTDGTINHWLIANTDFKQLAYPLLPQTERFFIDKNLQKNPHYKSTSFDLYGKPKEWKWKFLGNQWSVWTLPYRSTMVWPIRKTTKPEEKREGQLFHNQDLLGFLCVDSYARGVFDERYDFDFGALVSDNFYMLFGAFRAKLEQRLPMKKT
ncbi:MAG: hypothetical protein NUV86_04425 [Candidatus Scalindua sp.]|nr:hypothetical protein [Candidatus Scalindua sp.]